MPPFGSGRVATLVQGLAATIGQGPHAFNNTVRATSLNRGTHDRANTEPDVSPKGSRYAAGRRHKAKTETPKGANERYVCVKSELPFLTPAHVALGSSALLHSINRDQNRAMDVTQRHHRLFAAFQGPPIGSRLATPGIQLLPIDRRGYLPIVPVPTHN